VIRAGDKLVWPSSVIRLLGSASRPDRVYAQPLSPHHQCLPVRMRRRRAARTQLQQAVIASRAPKVDRKPVTALSRTKVAPLDRQRLSATIAMISHPDASPASVD
jgi:hypothetical protein